MIKPAIHLVVFSAQFRAYRRRCADVSPCMRGTSGCRLGWLANVRGLMLIAGMVLLVSEGVHGQSPQQFEVTVIRPNLTGHEYRDELQRVPRRTDQNHQ
jgi:hypothetical protein